MIFILNIKAFFSPMNVYHFLLFTIFLRTITSVVHQNPIPEQTDSMVDFINNELSVMTSMFYVEILALISFKNDMKQLMKRIAMLQIIPESFYKKKKFKNLRLWIFDIGDNLTTKIILETILDHTKRSYELIEQIKKRYPSSGIFHNRNDHNFSIFTPVYDFGNYFEIDEALMRLKFYFMDILANFLFKKFGYKIIDDDAFDWLEDINSKILMKEIAEIYSEELDRYALCSNEFHLLLYKMIGFMIQYYDYTFI